MKVLDLFCGTGSSTQAFLDRGHQVVKVEIDPGFESDICDNVNNLAPSDFQDFDVIWASPPCQCFSIASVGHYWEKCKPKNEKTLKAIETVKNTLAFIHGAAPRFWYMENPRGMLRKQGFMRPYKRNTITYCRYRDINRRMKPTDIWNNNPYWVSRVMCSPGEECHDRAPRGSREGGTEGIKGSKGRSMVPYELSLEICKISELYLDGGWY